MSLKDTKTEKNILGAFAGESQARNRYTYFASKAKKEGYVQIANIFEETANQEKEHAKRLFKFMTGGTTEITAAFPFGPIGTTRSTSWTDVRPREAFSRPLCSCVRMPPVRAASKIAFRSAPSATIRRMSSFMMRIS